jgi:CRISPR-associated endonuclease/helicase Cas3
MQNVLAKSPHCDRSGSVREVTLAAHTQHVVDSAKAMFGADQPTFLAEQWLRFFKIPQQFSVFQRNLTAACGLHDLGKANDTFQAALTRGADQAIRHEHLSALLLGLPVVADWLKRASIDYPLVLSCVLTHHLKASDRRDGFAQKKGVSGFRLVDAGGGFQQTMEITERELGLPRLLASSLPQRWTFDAGHHSVRNTRQHIQDEVLEPFWREIRKDAARSRLLLAVRSALIAADAVGSGIVRTGSGSVAEWIDSNVTQRPRLTAEEVNDLIIGGRVSRMKAGGQWKGWNKFQLHCDELPSRALLLAPCGSGKTLAAWRWIAAQLAQRPAGHAIFLYPTRATAREGFKDYVSWAPEADAALMHGTSEFDLAGMFSNPEESDDRGGRDYVVERRLFSLGYWSRRAFSATVDQFLAFMQYGYGALCMLPVLVNSVVVIDEVHSFDDSMFSALKDFLRAFDVPVLCMTATLPANRRDQLLNECGLAKPPEWPADLVALADRPRYRLRCVSSRADAEARVRAALAAGKRVLWVVNQVRRAHEIVRQFVPTLPNLPPDGSNPILRTADGAPVVCYHSRFQLNDRIQRHSETMSCLKASNCSAALGVTTQVCEMSLDIDVDLLITEECPVPSLIQRMGRCNRNRDARPLEQSGEVIVYAPDENDILPYDRNDLTGLKEFLHLANGVDLSQSDLDQLMRQLPCAQLPGDRLSRFLESGPYAVGPREEGGEEFRDSADFSRQCVLESNIDQFRHGGPRERPGLIVPVPKKWVRSRSEVESLYCELPSWIGVAPQDHYHPAVGFLDHPVSQWSSVT